MQILQTMCNSVITNVTIAKFIEIENNQMIVLISVSSQKRKFINFLAKTSISNIYCLVFIVYTLTDESFFPFFLVYLKEVLPAVSSTQHYLATYQ